MDSNESHKLLNLQQHNNKNFLSNQNYEKLNKRFKQKLKQVTYTDDLMQNTHSMLTDLYSYSPADVMYDNHNSPLLQQILHFYDKKIN